MIAADLVVRIPDWLDTARATAGLLKGVTAGFLLHDVRAVERGEWVVVHAAAGAIGPREIGPMASKSLTLSRPNYGHYIADRVMMTLQAERRFTAIERGILKIP